MPYYDGPRSPAARLCLAAGLLGLLLTSHAVHAGSFTVEPVKVVLSADKPAGVLRVRNTQESDITVQIEALAWSQPAGSDELTATSDLIAVPPMFTLEADAHQIVRVGLRKPMQASKELAYRLVLREVPPPPKPGFKGLRVALRISMPVFVTPPHEVEPKPSWSAASREDGTLELAVENEGNAHLRIAGLKLVRKTDDALVAADDELVYVLPDAGRRWRMQPVRPVAIGDFLQIRIQSNGRTLRAQAVVK